MSAASMPHESTFFIAGRVAATLRTPAVDGIAPCVLLLHGFASSRDEVGGAFARLADGLAANGIGSLRIDFAGWGESRGDTADTTVVGQIDHALLAMRFLTEADAVDCTRLGILGFSFGGGIAATVAARLPDTVRAVALWGSVGSFHDDLRTSLGDDVWTRAASSDTVALDLGWRTVRLRHSFFESLQDVDIMGALAAYRGALLVVAGSDDPLARYLEAFMAVSAARQKSSRRVSAADHIFHALDPARSRVDEVVAETAAWFAHVLRDHAG